MVSKFCVNCSKEYKCKNYLEDRRKYCSQECEYEKRIGRVPWNKGLIGWKRSELTGRFINCKICNKRKYFEPNQLIRRPCIYCSVSCARIDSRKSVPGY